MLINFLRNSAEALIWAATSSKVDGGIRRKVSMRRTSQRGAGMIFQALPIVWLVVGAAIERGE
ncbi:MAG: hypothetical protein C5B50_02005 [Verrucomicrobia bacterium]|nr:MAG: hypothetical protein C5B50_02005 [Verrucomicrobiota bacterium]